MTPWTESERLRALDSYHILDTDAEKDFDDIAKLAAQICDMPVSMVNFLTDTRQWFKAKVGTDWTGTPRDVSFCQHTILQDEVMIVPDATQDERFKDNPLVTGDPGIRSYAAARLDTIDGLPLGTMCVIDVKPRQFGEKEIFALKTLARQVMSQLELRRALREQRKGEGFLRNLLESIPDCVKVVDLDGKLDWMSQYGLRLMEIKDFTTVRHQSWLDFWKDDATRQEAEKALAEARSGRESRFRGFCPTQMGTPRWWDVMVAPIPNSDGRPESILSISRDVTFQKQNEDEINESRVNLESHIVERTAQLHETVEELATFSYSISHDLRAPLRAMQSFAECLAEECHESISPRGLDYISRITRASSRMDRLIQDILVYSRIARAEIKLESIDADKLLREIVESDFNFRDTRATIKIADQLPHVWASQSLFIQCLTNLLANAVKFVPPGTAPHIHITSRVHEGWVKIAIRDNGIGIDQNHQDRIFGLFHQIEPAHGSTGIGLSVARKAAERMSGRLTVESQLGKGSTFTVELKLVE